METRAHPSTTGALRVRVTTLKAPETTRTSRVRFAPVTPLQRLQKQRDRIVRLQRRWEGIKTDLSPQFSRKHIGMISIGGVIGTGLFLGSADALRNGGPIGEMLAYFPNVGGVIGLADLYVDPALGFSLGWAAWYNWSITLLEITAAAVVLGYWESTAKIPVAATSIVFLICALLVNFLPPKHYGEIEFYLLCFKVLTIVVIIVIGLLIDFGASHQGPIGFRYWIEQPFPPAYLGIKGAKGHLLSFWAVIMQASFSFFGSDVPGILPDLLNAAILVSARSAAASDIYVGSRLLFFLARKDLAPSCFAHLFRFNKARTVQEKCEHERAAENADISSDDEGSVAEEPRESPSLEDGLGPVANDCDPNSDKEFVYVLPLAGVLATASVGFLTLLSSTAGSASAAFQWLAAAASVACLQSWTGMLYTYIRWHQGTVYAEKKCADMPEDEAETVREQIKEIKKNRQWGQPYLAWYAFSLSILVLLTNGWAVFAHSGWRIAEITDEILPQYSSSQREANPVSQFLSAYVPIPFFLLLTFGYKLIKQTRMTPLDEMVFYRGRVPSFDPLEDEPKNWLEKLLQWVRVI
ncbi:uncharacterized protein TRAVEDRAFT_53768 [Trametes versicolor FP-101664 SS1]|uniref:uncharacterized protein n=1 Tax=Trametes versicolor (strain FP-101664) TaxID=717944 RepID=UPI0004622A7C|nr:uncharacterized protein TRAVEDRAFT_53768 [Trametes versicolor FP-101664 SS1]EIW52351.1 hypothetical protein TRAVEDRAFT_53768 [Trametes versicolor FP-101664 SS1]